MENVKKEERLTRYILEKNKYSIEKKRVKYNAFLPNKDGQTSVFRTSELTDNEIWEIGNNEVARKVEKQLLGRGDIKASNVYENSLKIDTEGEHLKHANIVNWPEEKSEQKLIAIEIADKATPHFK